MRKVLILFLLLLLTNTIGLFSQNKLTGVNLSLTSKICTQPFDQDTPSIEEQITYLNIGIDSKVDHLYGLASNLFALRSNCIKGVSVAGFGHLNHLCGEYDGVCIGGIMNMSPSGVKGLQIAGVLNSADNIVGIQISGLLGFADELRGMQIAPFNICGDCKGAQIGIANCWLGEKATLFQLGLINFNRFTKIGKRDNSVDNVFGVQVSGLIGITDALRGVQIAPFNFCGDCKGGQIGIVNYCSSEEKSTIFQLGLINLNRSTKIQAMIFGGNSSLMNVGIRFRGKLFYNMVGMGTYSFHLNNKFSWNLSYRSGLWLPINKYLDISGDIGYQHLMTGKNRNESLPGSLYALQARLNLECKIRSKLSLFLSGGYEVIRHYGRNKTHSHQPIIEEGIILF